MVAPLGGVLLGKYDIIISQRATPSSPTSLLLRSVLDEDCDRYRRTASHRRNELSWRMKTSNGSQWSRNNETSSEAASLEELAPLAGNYNSMIQKAKRGQAVATSAENSAILHGSTAFSGQKMSTSRCGGLCAKTRYNGRHIRCSRNEGVRLDGMRRRRNGGAV